MVGLSGDNSIDKVAEHLHAFTAHDLSIRRALLVRSLAHEPPRALTMFARVCATPNQSVLIGPGVSMNVRNCERRREVSSSEGTASCHLASLAM